MLYNILKVLRNPFRGKYRNSQIMKNTFFTFRQYVNNYFFELPFCLNGCVLDPITVGIVVAASYSYIMGCDPNDL